MAVYILISVLILLVCFLLGLVVLVQDSKGGGLTSNFSSSNQYMGVRKTADFLEKSTWTLAVLLLVFSLTSVFVLPRHHAENGLQNNSLQQIQDKAQEKTGATVNYTEPPTQPEESTQSEQQQQETPVQE